MYVYKYVFIFLVDAVDRKCSLCSVNFFNRPKASNFNKYGRTAGRIK